MRAAMKLAVVEAAVPNAFDQPLRMAFDRAPMSHAQAVVTKIDRCKPSKLRQRIVALVIDRCGAARGTAVRVWPCRSVARGSAPRLGPQQLHVRMSRQGLFAERRHGAA